MFKRRKGNIRKKLDGRLLETLLDCKRHWERQKHLVESSIDPSPEVMFELKLAETKYMYMLKEAKNRQVSLK